MSACNCGKTDVPLGLTSWEIGGVVHGVTACYLYTPPGGYICGCGYGGEHTCAELDEVYRRAERAERVLAAVRKKVDEESTDPSAWTDGWYAAMREVREILDGDAE